MDSQPLPNHPWLFSLAYLAGVVLALTAVAALLTYVIDPNGHTLGKLNSFGWIWVINVLLALPGFVAFRIGVGQIGWQVGHARWYLGSLAAFAGGGLLVGVYLLLRPLFVMTGAPFALTMAYFIGGSLLLPAVANWLGRRF